MNKRRRKKRRLTLRVSFQNNKNNHSSSEFSDQIFFHVSEVVTEGGDNGEEQQQQQQSNRGQKRQQQQQQPRDIAALVAPGTEVEFTVGPVAGRAARQAALQVKALPPGSLDPYDISEERLVGLVERELRGGTSGSSRRGPVTAATGAYGGRLVFTPAVRSEEEGGGTAAGGGAPSLQPESLAFDAGDLALMGVHDASLARTGAVGFGAPPFDPGPRRGETVEFSVATDKRTGERRAMLVARRRERGIVVHTKRSNEGQGGLFGFIRPIDRRSSEQHVYFHESQVVVLAASGSTEASTGEDAPSSLEPIKPGDEVTMVVAVLDAAAGRASALAVQVQPPGTFPEFVPVPGWERVEGRVVSGGGVGGRGEKGGALSIAYIDEETGAEARVQWKAGSRKEEGEGKGGDDDGEEGEGAKNGDGGCGGDDDNDDEASAAADATTAAAPSSSSSPSGKSSSPILDDDVVFTLARSTRGLGGGDSDERKRALAVELVRRGSDRRELGAISALKGSYGLIKCCDRPGTVLFRYEEFAEGEEGVPSSSSSSSTATAAADAAADNDEDGDEDDAEEEKGKKEPSPAAKLARACLSKGADVEFSIARDAKGRAVAVRVRRAPAGSAVFETESARVRQGWVVERLRAKGTSTLSSGVVEFFGEVGGGDDDDGEGGKRGGGGAGAAAIANAAAAAAAAAASSSSSSNEQLVQPDAAATAAALAAATAASIQTGPRARLPFTAGDLADPKVNPRVGDAVVFRVATDPRVARAAVRRAGAHSLVARIAGRRASRVAPLVLRGSVAMTKGGFGFLEYDAASLKEALAAGGGAAGVEAAERKMAAKVKEEGEREAAAVDEAEEKKGEGEEEAAVAQGDEERKEGGEGDESASEPSAAALASSSGSLLPSAAAASHRTKLRVYYRAAEVEAIVEKSGGDGAEKGEEEGEGEEGAAPSSTSSSIPTVPVLRRGDLVEFTLAEKHKTRESMAHRVKKIGDGPGGGGGGGGKGGLSSLSSSSSRPRLFLAERNPQGIKFTSNAAAGVRGNLAVRLAKCPPEGGARGFTPETSPGSRAGLVEKYHELKAVAEAEAAAEAARLNPKATEFVPPPGLGAALVGGGAAASEEAAAAAAVSKLAVVEAKEGE